MALRILEGASLQSIPIEAAAVRPVFDWRQLQRWGIDESLLPPGSDIRLRVPTVWELYGSYIIATFVVVIAQLLLITVLLRTAGAAAPRRQHDSCEGSVAAHQLRSDQAHGRPPHQRPGSGARRHCPRSARRREPEAGLLSRSASTPSETPPATSRIRQTQQAFEELERETRNTFEGIRRLSHDLHPATLRLLGLAPALRSHCDEVAKRQGVEVTFSSGDNVGTVHPDVAVCFFRIAQESLRNGIVHGGAKHLAVTLTRSDDQLELAVADDGRGFDVNAVQSNGGGLGLVTMEERANLVGGDVSIASEVGRGTTVRVRGPASPVMTTA